MQTSEPTAGRLALASALALLVALAAWASAWPVYRAGFDVEIDTNEGWNAHFAEAALGASPLYPGPERLTANNYPPLSFYAVGALGRVLGDPLGAGRLLSLVGVGLIAVAIAWVLAILGAAPPARWLGAALLVGTVSRFNPGYVGMNDPQLFGQGLMALGFAAFLRALHSDRGTTGPLLLMVLAGFVKHNLVVMPLVAFVALASRRPRRLVPCLLVAGGAAAAGLLACHLVYGPAFFANLLLPRASRGWGAALEALLRLHVAVVGLVATGLLALYLRALPGVKLVCLWVALGVAALALQKTGMGVSGNAGFDAYIALSVAAGLLFHLAPRLRLPAWLDARGARLLLVLGACLRVLLWTDLSPARLVFDAGFRADAHARERITRQAVAEVRALPGDVLTSSYLTFRAGKPFAVDAFSTRQRILAGALPADAVEQRIARGDLTVYVADPRTRWSR